MPATAWRCRWGFEPRTAKEIIRIAVTATLEAR